MDSKTIEDRTVERLEKFTETLRQHGTLPKPEPDESIEWHGYRIEQSPKE